VEFRDDAELDTSQVEDVRGRRVPGGKVAIGGGGLGLIGAILAIVLALSGGGGGLSSALTQLDDQSVAGSGAVPSDLKGECASGADANAKDDCRIVGYVNSIQAYWTQQFADEGKRYTPSRTVFFDGQVNTGCGAASSEVGPFYCPSDKKVYIDLGFYDDLHSKFGADAGPAAQAYVLAHEYGHHIQDLEGTFDQIGSDRQGAQSAAVRSELQADCYAGVWAKNASTTPGSSGRPLITDVTDADVSAALDTASRIGDDYIQSNLGGGRVNESEFTHGTSAQRQKWYLTGYQSGDLTSCNTFDTGDLG
jgi:predicted metalloprotease